MTMGSDFRLRNSGGRQDLIEPPYQIRKRNTSYQIRQSNTSGPTQLANYVESLELFQDLFTTRPCEAES
jgi:hypothetical protein